MDIPFYYDYACPWAYLGSCRVESYFGDVGEIDFRPVVLADLKEQTAGQGPRPGDRKKRWYAADLRQWAELVGADFSPRARESRPDTRLLLRAAWVALEAGRFRQFHYPAYRARWAEARDVASPQVVRELLDAAGLDGAEALERAGSEEVGERLRRETEQAIERGVFGVPTLFIGERMFWGNDRFELAHWFARKHL